ncbi:hypothetical protein OAK19_01615 [Aureispira]|nr:hypothetical protein [Aureispira sp.]
MHNHNEFENFLTKTYPFVHKINGFYIIASDEKPRGEYSTGNDSGKDVFEHSVRLFSNFLDQDEDGKVDQALLPVVKGLKSRFLFASGYQNFVDQVIEDIYEKNKNLYVMTMNTDSWPYVADYNGKGWEIEALNSSLWRPENCNALWEEVFHTITESYSFYDPDFSFSIGKPLRTFMDTDIRDGTYDISEQNSYENGHYDIETAVNEYIHQIWAIQFAGKENKLNEHQQKALQFLKDKGVPMKLNPDYRRMLGLRLK